MANLVQNGDFSAGITDWLTIDMTTTTDTFFGSSAIQVDTTIAFGGLLSQSIDLTSVNVGDTINIAYYIAAAIDTSTAPFRGGCNFAAWLNTTNVIDGGATQINGSLINDVNWPLTNIEEYYLQEFTWTVTPAAKTNGSIFLIFNISNGDFNTGIFTLTEVWFSTTPFCYNEGTQILCINRATNQEEYRAIENIRIGDLVQTYKRGPRAVTQIGKGELMNSHTNPKCCMYKLPKSGNMIDDLIITGNHSILVDSYESREDEQLHIANHGRDARIEDKRLLLARLSSKFIRLPEGEKYTYYQFSLDNRGNNNFHYGVWANGVLSESCSEDVYKTHNLTPLN